jgi:hypothetical protein
MKINNLETVINILDNIPNLKRVNENKYFHKPSFTTIKINTSKKALANHNGALCQIITDYGIAGTPVNEVTVCVGCPIDAFKNYINQTIKDSWWNK